MTAQARGYLVPMYEDLTPFVPLSRVMAAAKAAGDFGLETRTVAELGLSYDARADNVDEVVDAFAAALLDSRTVRLD